MTAEEKRWLQINSHQIDNNPFNQKLKEEVYKKYFTPEFSKLVENYNLKPFYDEKEDFTYYITNPQLITVSNEFYHAKHKILLLLEDPFTWGGNEDPKLKGYFNKDLSIDWLMKFYDFYRLEQLTKPKNNPWKYYKYYQDVVRPLGGEVLYGNISPLGYVGATGFNPDICCHLYPINHDIVEICQPSIIIIFAAKDHGNRDKALEKSFGQLKDIEDLTPNGSSVPLWKCESSMDEFKDIIFYRTYHPNCRNSHSDKERVKEKLASLLENIIKNN